MGGAGVRPSLEGLPYFTGTGDETPMDPIPISNPMMMGHPMMGHPMMMGPMTMRPDSGSGRRRRSSDGFVYEFQTRDGPYVGQPIQDPRQRWHQRDEHGVRNGSNHRVLEQVPRELLDSFEAFHKGRDMSDFGRSGGAREDVPLYGMMLAGRDLHRLDYDQLREHLPHLPARDSHEFNEFRQRVGSVGQRVGSVGRWPQARSLCAAGYGCRLQLSCKHPHTQDQLAFFASVEGSRAKLGYKLLPCRYFERGTCRYMGKPSWCTFAHGRLEAPQLTRLIESELTQLLRIQPHNQMSCAQCCAELYRRCPEIRDSLRAANVTICGLVKECKFSGIQMYSDASGKDASGKRGAETFKLLTVEASDGYRPSSNFRTAEPIAKDLVLTDPLPSVHDVPVEDVEGRMSTTGQEVDRIIQEKCVPAERDGLTSVVDEIRVALSLEASLPAKQVIDAASARLGISLEGKPMKEQAAECLRVMQSRGSSFHDEEPAPAGRLGEQRPFTVVPTVACDFSSRVVTGEEPDDAVIMSIIDAIDHLTLVSPVIEIRHTGGQLDAWLTVRLQDLESNTGDAADFSDCELVFMHIGSLQRPGETMEEMPAADCIFSATEASVRIRANRYFFVVARKYWMRLISIVEANGAFSAYALALDSRQGAEDAGFLKAWLVQRTSDTRWLNASYFSMPPCLHLRKNAEYKLFAHEDVSGSVGACIARTLLPGPESTLFELGDRPRIEHRLAWTSVEGRCETADAKLRVCVEKPSGKKYAWQFRVTGRPALPAPAPVPAPTSFVPPLTPPKNYHFFICHHQGSGGDQAHLLCEALRFRGYKVWYDNCVQSEERNLEGMQRGVRSSACLLLLLSGRKEFAGVPDSSGVYEGPFTRWYCHQEMAAARSERLPVIGVMEVEDRYNKVDFVEEKRRARTGGRNGGPISEHAEDILALLEGDRSVVFINFRRDRDEWECMLDKICLEYVTKVVDPSQRTSPWDR